MTREGLIKYFLFNKDIEFQYPRKEFLEECKKISMKGINCYDIFDEYDGTSGYKLVCKPSCELRISDIPRNIQNILLHYRIPNVNFNNDKIITIDK